MFMPREKHRPRRSMMQRPMEKRSSGAFCSGICLMMASSAKGLISAPGSGLQPWTSHKVAGSTLRRKWGDQMQGVHNFNMNLICTIQVMDL